MSNAGVEGGPIRGETLIFTAALCFFSLTLIPGLSCDFLLNLDTRLLLFQDWNDDHFAVCSGEPQ